MQFRIFITVDENDADYQYSQATISMEELTKVKELLEEIKKFKPYRSVVEGLDFEQRSNFPVGDCHRKDLNEKSRYELYGEDMREHIDFFLGLCPYCEHGFHSVVSVEVALEEDIVELY